MADPLNQAACWRCSRLARRSSWSGVAAALFLAGVAVGFVINQSALVQRQTRVECGECKRKLARIVEALR